MRLLFITQKLHGQDSFGVFWIREFLRQGFLVTVICLEGNSDAEKFEFPVFTLGKEKGFSRLHSVLCFEGVITTQKYDRVFVHMAPVWYALGFWWWMMRRVPTYLWYTHYQMQIGVRLFGWLGTRFFCATPQSLPQYVGSEKKVVVGHGIDLRFWPQRQNTAVDAHRLLVVHRLSRSKRLELSIKALTHLDSSYSIDVYGIEAEADYVQELRKLVQDLGFTNRVTFHGTITMDKLPTVYSVHRFILNMASETIDKTMLEAMTCGCYPVTTKRNAEAIGIPYALDQDTPETIAGFIKHYSDHTPIDGHAMYRIVQERHSLEGLVTKMGEYIRRGQ